MTAIIQRCRSEMQMQENLQESRINPIVQLSKHYYRRSKYEAGESMWAAMNVFVHYRKLTNFSMSLLSEICL